MLLYYGASNDGYFDYSEPHNRKSLGMPTLELLAVHYVNVHAWSHE